MVQPKAMSKIIYVDQAEKMLQHFESYNFIKKRGNGIQFSFLIQSLQEYVRREWLQSNLVTCDWSSFQFNTLKTNENVKTAVEEVKSFTGITPFSLIAVEKCPNDNEEKTLPEPTNAAELVKNQFKKQTGTILRNQTFCSHENAVEIFNKKQRERKNWWRKLSAVPGRFVTSVVGSKENNRTLISEIQAVFPWGLETVETVEYIPDFCSRENLLIEVNITRRKKSAPQVVSCEALLEKVAFTYLCDAYGKLDGKNDRDLLKLDRKLAPFKVAIAGTGDGNELTKSLEELALLLAKQVRKLGHTVLLLPDACTTPVDRQILRNDAIGVPFTIVLNEKTLKEGFVGLRSRDTTLQEDSHVSLIAEYLSKILK